MSDWLKCIAARGDKASSKYVHDRFGLPIKPQGTESTQERLWREAVTRREAKLVLAEMFSSLKNSIGADEARKLFDPFKIHEPIRKKGEHGERNPERDQELLDIYDSLAERKKKAGGSGSISSLPREMGGTLDAERPGRFGNSPDAIEKKIRRLLKARKEETAKLDEARRDLENQISRIARISSYLAERQRRRDAAK